MKRITSSIKSGSLLLLAAACLVSGCTDMPAEETETTVIAPTPTPVDVENASVQTVSVGDIDIAYKQFGEGDPLVLVMGYAGTMDMWPTVLLQELSRDYRVTVFDNRGMGDTTSSEKEYRIPLFADDTAGLMEALGMDSAHILGWSMGADIALELAHRHPERVNTLILNAADPGGNESVPMDPEVEQKILNTSGTDMERGQRLLSVLFPPEWMTAHPNPMDYFPAVEETTPPENIARQGEAMGMRSGVSPWLGNITAPTLLIVGDQDIISPPANSFFIGERIPAASVVQLRGGGHGAMYQYPETFAEVVRVFVGMEKK